MNTRTLLTKTWLPLIALAIGVSALISMEKRAVSATDQRERPAPQFTQTDAKSWINSEPLKIEDLRDKVVLLDVWTFGCWNCYRSFPWLRDLESRYEDQGLQVIGIHTPEFDHEKNPASVRAKVREFDLHHPVMMDNDMAYWRALNNRYWPAYYLIDKSGTIRALFIGETHQGDRRAKAIESAVVELLKEST